MIENIFTNEDIEYMSTKNVQALAAELEIDQKQSRVLLLLGHPWRIIKEGGALGIKGVKRFAAITILFGFSNLAFVIWAIYKEFVTSLSVAKFFAPLLVIIIGLIFTVIASRRAYQFAVLEILHYVHKGLTKIYARVSKAIIDRSEKLMQGNLKLKDAKLTKALDSAKLINSTYQKAPRLVKKGIAMILNRIPMVPMISELRGEILAGKKVEASTKLHSKIETYLGETLFGNNNTNWVYWMLPLNFALQWLIIRLMIG